MRELSACPLAFRERNLPAVIELRYDGELITPGATLAAIRKAAEAAAK